MPSVVNTQLRLGEKSRVHILIYVDSKPSEKTAKQLVKNILRTFRPSTGAIFNANNVPQTGWLATTNGVVASQPV